MKEIRNIFIGAKVTPSQKEYIKESADKCGMSVSDYLLARAYNYEPKHRLTEAEVSALQNLNNCRADIVQYTSALKGMEISKRMQMFNSYPYMLGWLERLADMGNSITAFLDKVKTQNNLPPKLEIEES